MKTLPKLALAALVAAASLPAHAQQLLLDDEWTMGPGGSQRYTVTLKTPTAVRIEIVGVKHAAKGFRVELSDEGSLLTRAFRRSSQWAAGAHVLEVKNTENVLNRLTVRVRLLTGAQAQGRVDAPKRLTSTPSPSGPERVGKCVETTVREVSTRFQGSADSGTAITFANGVGLVSYDRVPAAEGSRVGDRVALCLTGVPTDCPPGDIRGRIYTVSNHRSSEKFTMQNSSHSCGGA